MVNTKKAKSIGWAAVGVVAGVVLFNNLTALAGNTPIGKFLNGKLVRSA